MSQTLYTNLSQIYSMQGSGPVVDGAAITDIRNGAIVVDGDRIAALGSESDLHSQFPKADVVDLQGKTAIPAFVDPHTHLVWGGDRSDEFNRRLHGANYVDIAAAGGGIKSTVSHTRAASADELKAKAEKTLDQMLLHGVATIETKSGYGLDLETEMKQLDVMDGLSASHPMEMIQTFMGAHEVPPEYKGNPAGYIDYVNGEMLPAVKARGTVRYVDIFCEKNVFELDDSRRHLELALELGFELRIHADELFPLGGAGLAAELGAHSADHLVHASKDHMKKMAEAGTTATLLPGTSFFLRGPYANADGFREAGCAVALSTDYNPGSSHTVNQALMMALACMNMSMTFEQAFTGVTLNAAASLKLAHEIGTLEPGKKADIAFLEAPSAMYLVYYWGINHVSDLLKDGAFVVRDRRRV